MQQVLLLVVLLGDVSPDFVEDPVVVGLSVDDRVHQRRVPFLVLLVYQMPDALSAVGYQVRKDVDLVLLESSHEHGVSPRVLAFEGDFVVVQESFE